MNKYKLISFDVTNTLLRFRIHPTEQYAKIAEDYGVKVNLDLLKRSFKEQWKKLYLEHPNFGASSGLSSRDWWMMFVKGTFANAKCITSDEQMSKISSHLIDLFATKECWRIADGSFELLSLLKKNNFKLGVISNFDDRLHSILKDVELHPFFDFVVCSYVVKCAKPDPKIFHIALEMLNNTVDPSEALHVGDDVQLDYIGARNAGWHSVLLRKNSTLITSDIDKKFVIDDLRQLTKIIFNNNNKTE